MIIKDLDAWVEKFSRRDMPVLANVIGELNQITASDKATANQLVDIILKDPNLTAQVLRIANGVKYNPTSNQISTVSRAVITIGFSGIRAICLSVGLIDSMLGATPRERLLETMAASFHAAVQAKDLAKGMGAPEKEEVFIAALLMKLGEMAFWANTGSQVEELEERLTHPGVSMKKASHEVLGTSMKSISSRLGKIWRLGDTLQDALFLPPAPSSKVMAVKFGEQISEASKFGWESEQMLGLFGKIAKYSGRPLEDIQRDVMNNAQIAIDIANTYGASRVTHLIPAPQNIQLIVDKQNSNKEKPVKKKKDVQMKQDALSQLAAMVGKKIDVNLVFNRVLEGLHNGAGIERVVIGVINNQRTRLNAKYAIGQNTERWRRDFSFRLDDDEDDLFDYAINVREPFWFGLNELKTFEKLYTPKVCSVIGRYPAFLSGLHIGNRCVGVFYADRATSDGDLDDMQFEAFRDFVRQTEETLGFLAETSKFDEKYQGASSKQAPRPGFM